MHAITFDVEAWFHAHNLNIPPSQWDRLPHRLDACCETILELLHQHRQRGTFFVLGWIADRHPELVRRIHEAGHEIASHGYAHQPINTQSPDQFRHDLVRAKRVLESLIGLPVHGYRAPSYSVTESTGWALDIIQETGHRYDSSIYPVRAPHGRYGIPGASLRPFWVRPHLMEFPLPTTSCMGRRLPALTGGYLRLYPINATLAAMNRNAREGVPVVVNIHPWELDPNQPRTGHPGFKRWLHYQGLRKTRSILATLLARYRFGPLRDLMPTWQHVSAPARDVMPTATGSERKAAPQPVALSPSSR